MSKAPKLRFKEFSGDWESKRLNDLCEKIMVGIASSATHAYRTSGIIMFRNQNIKPNHLDDTDILYLDEQYEKTHKSKRLMPGDLLTARTGYPGTTCVVPDKYINAQSFTTLITRPNKDLAISEYLSQYINSDIGTKFFKSVEIGGGQKNVNAETLKSLPISIPSLKEQEKIASFFSLIDDKISLQGEKVEALKDYKRSMMQKIFSKELRFKDDEGRDYPEWEEKKLGDIANLTSSKRVFASDYVDEGIPFYRGKEITELKQNKKPSDILYITQEKYDDIKNNFGIPVKGDLLLTAVGTLGNSYVIKDDNPFYFKDGNLIWFKDIKEDVNFLNFILTSEKGQKKIIDSAIGSTQKALTIVELNKLKYEFPSLMEQRKIANFLDNLEIKVIKEEEKLDFLKQYKKGLLQQMFV